MQQPERSEQSQHSGQSDQEDIRPRSDGALYVLLSLCQGEKHGYGIMKEVKNKSRNMITIGPGTLYRSLTKMLEEGLVEETFKDPQKAKQDERVRRYYRATPLGKRVASAEVDRREREIARMRREWPIPDPDDTR